MSCAAAVDRRGGHVEDRVDNQRDDSSDYQR